MSDWASPEDVTGRWVGDGKPTDEDLLQQLIDDAEEIVRFNYPEIEDRVYDPDSEPEPDEHPLPIGRVRLVVSRMVTRVLRNPDGVRQISETEGPFTRFRGFGAERAGDMALTDEDREMLGYQPGAPAQRAFTITPGGTDTDEIVYLGGSDDG